MHSPFRGPRHVLALAPALAPAAVLLASAPLAGQEAIRDIERDGWQRKYLTRDGTDIWRFEGKPGMVVRGIVETSEFDPTIALVQVLKDTTDGQGAAERVLVRRDDPGSTSRFMKRITEAGKYEIRIHGFNHRGGGNYRIHVDRWRAEELAIGTRVQDRTDDQGKAVYWFRARRGEILTATNSGNLSGQRFVAANGHDMQTWVTSVTIPADGEYVTMLRGERDTAFWHRLDRAQKVALAVDKVHEPELLGFSMMVFEFRGERGDFRTLELDHDASVETRLLRLEDKGKDKDKAEGKDRGTAGAAADLDLDPDLPDVRYLPVASKGGKRRLAFVVERPGTYQYQLLTRTPRKTRHRLQMVDPTRLLEFDKPAAAQLDIGGAHFHAFSARGGQFLAIGLSSSSFDPLLRLTNAHGQEIGWNDNGGEGLGSQIRFLVRRPGRYRLQVASVGDGGGGDYALTLKELAIPKIAVGETEEGTVTGHGVTYWHLEGKRDQEIFVSVKSPVVNPTVEIMGPGGVTLKRDADGGIGHDSLLAVRLPRNGRYTISVFAAANGGKYTLRVIDG